MELDIVGLLEANDGHLGVAITLHHQSLIGMQRKNWKGAAPVNIECAPQLARGDLDSLKWTPIAAKQRSSSQVVRNDLLCEANPTFCRCGRYLSLCRL